MSLRTKHMTTVSFQRALIAGDSIIDSGSLTLSMVLLMVSCRSKMIGCVSRYSLCNGNLRGAANGP